MIRLSRPLSPPRERNTMWWSWSCLRDEHAGTAHRRRSRAKIGSRCRGCDSHSVFTCGPEEGDDRDRTGPAQPHARRADPRHPEATHQFGALPMDCSRLMPACESAPRPTVARKSPRPRPRGTHHRPPVAAVATGPVASHVEAFCEPRPLSLLRPCEVGSYTMLPGRYAKMTFQLLSVRRCCSVCYDQCPIDPHALWRLIRGRRQA